MTELVQYEQAPTVIQHMADEMPHALKIATAIAASTFAPTHFRGKPEECAVAILYGATVGLSPLESVQQIYVIAGKPALYAKAMVAIVISAGHEMWVEEEKPGLCTVAGKRKGSDHVQSVTWTSEMAQQAGYTSNPKYRTDPKSMLYARASSDLARRIAPDALLGMSYSIEEMQLVPQQVEVVRPASRGPQDRVRAAIGTPKTSGSGDAGDRTAPAAPSAAPSPESEFTDLGITARPDRLAYSSKVVGRELASSNEMSKAEASAVIEALVADVAARDSGVEDADIVDDLTELRERVYLEGGTKGFDAWALEAKYAEGKQGQLLSDASGQDLNEFLAWLEKQPEVA